MKLRAYGREPDGYRTRALGIETSVTPGKWYFEHDTGWYWAPGRVVIWIRLWAWYTVCSFRIHKRPRKEHP